MAYNKQTFSPGQTLMAEDLNTMSEGITSKCEIIDVETLPVLSQPASAYLYTLAYGKNSTEDILCFVKSVDTLPEIGEPYFPTYTLYYNLSDELLYLYMDGWFEISQIDPETSPVEYVNSETEAIDETILYVVRTPAIEGEEVSPNSFYRTSDGIVYHLLNNEYIMLGTHVIVRQASNSLDDDFVNSITFTNEEVNMIIKYPDTTLILQVYLEGIGVVGEYIYRKTGNANLFYPGFHFSCISSILGEKTGYNLDHMYLLVKGSKIAEYGENKIYTNFGLRCTTSNLELTNKRYNDGVIYDNYIAQLPYTPVSSETVGLSSNKQIKEYIDSKKITVTENEDGTVDITIPTE